MKLTQILLFMFLVPVVSYAQLKAGKFMYLQSPGESSEAHGIVSSQKKYGIENRDNYLETEFIYERLYYLPHKQLYLARKDKKWGLIDKDQKIVIPFQYRLFMKTVQQYYVVEKEDKFGILDADLNLLIPLVYEDLLCYKLDHCLAKKEGKWGVIDGQGKTIVPHEYRDIEYSSDETYLASKDYKWGLINQANEVLMPFEYGDLKYVGRKRYLGKQGRYWALIDEKGTLVSEQQIDRIKPGNTENGVLFSSGKKWGLIGPNGQVLLKAIYEDINWLIRNEQYQIAKVKQEGKYGLYSLSDGWIEDVQYEKINRVGNDKPCYIVSLNQLQGVKENGKKVLLDIKYQGIYNIRVDGENYLKVKNQEGLLGLFDEQGQMLLPTVYVKINVLTKPGGNYLHLLLLEKESSAAVYDLQKRSLVINSEKEIKHLEYNSFAIRNDQWRLFFLDGQAYSDQVFDGIEVFKDKTDDYYGLEPTPFYKVKKLQEKDGQKLKPQYGLIDAKGKEVLATEFRSFKFLHGHFILCGTDDRYGLYDLKRDTFLGLTYAYASGTKDGIIVTSKVAGKEKPQYGFLDKEGKVVIPTQYDFLQLQSEGFVAQKNGQYGWLDAAGKERWPFEYQGIEVRSDLNLVFVKQQNKWGIKDLNGNQLLEPILDDPWVEKGQPIPFQRNGKYGYLNYLGKEIIPCQYDYAESFAEQMAIIGKDQLYGVTNLKNELIVPIHYDTIVRRAFDENFIVGKEKKKNHPLKWGLVNPKGETLLSMTYDTIWWDYSGQSYVLGQNGQYGLCNKKGKELIPVQYEEVLVRDRMIYVRQNGKQGLLNKKGQVLIPCKYDHISNTHGLYDNYILRLNGKHGLLSLTQQFTSPIVYDEIDILGAYALKLRQKDKWNLWAVSNKQVSEISYDSLALFGRKTFQAKKKSGWGIIDKDAKVLLPFHYDEIGRLYRRSKNFPQSMASIFKDKKQGYVLHDGTIFIHPKYQEIRAFQEGMARFRVNDLWGFMDDRGKEVIEAKYQSVEAFEHGLSKVQLKGKTFYIDKSGNCQKNCDD